MKKGILFIFLFFACVFFLMAGSARAASFSGQIWKPDGNLYNFSTYDLTDTFFATLGSPSDAQFTVDKINFDTQLFASPATYTQFLGGPGNVNNLVWAGSGATFGAQPIQTDGTHASFFQITGTAFFPASFTILWARSIKLMGIPVPTLKTSP